RRMLVFAIVLMGSYTTALAQMSGDIQLTIDRAGEQWKGEAKITTAGQQLLSSLREIKVINNQIAFTANVLETELRFTGTLAGDNLSGIIGGFRGEVSVATGTWRLKRERADAITGTLAGNWLGTFNLDATVQPVV